MSIFRDTSDAAQSFSIKFHARVPHTCSKIYYIICLCVPITSNSFRKHIIDTSWSDSKYVYMRKKTYFLLKRCERLDTQHARQFSRDSPEICRKAYSCNLVCCSYIAHVCVLELNIKINYYKEHKRCKYYCWMRHHVCCWCMNKIVLVFLPRKFAV